MRNIALRSMVVKMTLEEHLRNVLELQQLMGDSLYRTPKDKTVTEKKESKDKSERH